MRSDTGALLARSFYGAASERLTGISFGKMVVLANSRASGKGIAWAELKMRHGDRVEMLLCQESVER